MSVKRRVFVLSVSAAAAAVLVSVPATAGAATAATTSGHGGSAATAVSATVRENAAGTGLVLAPVPGVAQISKVYDGLTATSPTARTVPDADGSHPDVAGKATVQPATEGTYVETGPFTIQNQDTGACLDAQTQTLGKNGTVVQLWSCLGDPNQQWYEDNYGTYARIWNADAGQYQFLDAQTQSLGKDGTVVQLWQYIDGNTNQWWYVNGNGTITNQDVAAGVYTYLDADLNTIGKDGTKIQLWQKVGGSNQFWY